MDNVSIDKLKRSCEKELGYIADREQAMMKRAMKDSPLWRRKILEKVPVKVKNGLERAFSKAFCAVFEKGAAVIGKTFDREEAEKDHQVQDFAVKLKGSRKELKKVRKTAGVTDAVNVAITTVEGAGLGFLGIGFPDILLFTSFVLKGIYQYAAHYGRDFTDPREKYLILKMIEASLSRRDDWIRLNGEVDGLLMGEYLPTDEEMSDQIRRTADACAMDMLFQKFVQGLPVIGVIGGIANPVYYGKMLNLVKVKYHKAYVIGLLRRGG